MRNINLSYQRLKVLEYLTQNQCHPTADQIFTDLHKNILTLSKTTVYNTLNLLIRSGLGRVISIEGHEARYDINTKQHGHFKCISCGKICDFNINIDEFTTDDLIDFKITDKDVYFQGTCPRCLSNKK